jgi:hypothetical protein
MARSRNAVVGAPRRDPANIRSGPRQRLALVTGERGDDCAGGRCGIRSASATTRTLHQIDAWTRQHVDLLVRLHKRTGRIAETQGKSAWRGSEDAAGTWVARPWGWRRLGQRGRGDARFQRPSCAGAGRPRRGRP